MRKPSSGPWISNRNRPVDIARQRSRAATASLRRSNSAATSAAASVAKIKPIMAPLLPGWDSMRPALEEIAVRWNRLIA